MEDMQIGVLATMVCHCMCPLYKLQGSISFLSKLNSCFKKFIFGLKFLYLNIVRRNLFSIVSVI